MLSNLREKFAIYFLTLYPFLITIEITMKASKDISANILNRYNMHLLNVSQQRINMHFDLYIRAQYLNRFIIHLSLLKEYYHISTIIYEQKCALKEKIRKVLLTLKLLYRCLVFGKFLVHVILTLVGYYFSGAGSAGFLFRLRVIQWYPNILVISRFVCSNHVFQWSTG